MSGYDDMMGLEYGGLAEWIDMEMIKSTLIAASAGGAALLATSKVIQYATDKVDFLKRADANMQKVQNGVIQVVVGMAGGSALYRVSREASMGVIAGLGAVGVANIINGLVFKDKPISLGALPEEMELSAADTSLLSQYGEGMEALAALEATGVSTAPGAFQGFADPTVTNEALMGFNGTVVQQETLGGYAPYLS
jgi:hypothetical protein